jgi:uncharacterized protein (TIGR04222 family)
MNWTAPYLLAAFAALAALETWFVVAMVATRRPHRAIAPPGATSHIDLDLEDVGLLARSEKRRAEVALVRLEREGRIVVDGYIRLAPGQRVTDAERRGSDPRAAILDRLAGGRPQHLNDLLWAGSRRGDTPAAYRRLARLGLTDERLARRTLARERIMRWWMYLWIIPMIGVAVGLAAAAGSHRGPAIVGGIIAFGQWMVVGVLVPRLTGGQFQPLTAAGQAALERARRKVPDDPVLLQTALHGLAVLPQYRAAAGHGTPEEGLSPGGKNTSMLFGILQNVADLFTPGTGGRGR